MSEQEGPEIHLVEVEANSVVRDFRFRVRFNYLVIDEVELTVPAPDFIAEGTAYAIAGQYVEQNIDFLRAQAVEVQKRYNSYNLHKREIKCDISSDHSPTQGQGKSSSTSEIASASSPEQLPKPVSSGESFPSQTGSVISSQVQGDGKLSQSIRRFSTT